MRWRGGDELWVYGKGRGKGGCWVIERMGDADRGKGEEGRGEGILDVTFHALVLEEVNVGCWGFGEGVGC